MLTTPPVLAGSANASTGTFCRGHAPARSPQTSPKVRRASLATASSSVPPRPSSQLRSASSGAAVSLHACGAESPASPRPQPRRAPATSASSSVPVPVTAPTSAAPPDPARQARSPNKRRGGSPAHGFGQSVASPLSQSTKREQAGAKTPKRPKMDDRPPKTLPLRYELCPVEDMVELIAHMLGELIATNDAIRISSGGLTRFHSRTAPAISVSDYLHRLARHATLTPPLLLAMVYYIDRLCALYQEFTINTLTVHRFLITAATVAAKGLSDSFWNNTTYARVGGVRVAELKMLELEFLYRVDWKIVPNPEVLVAYYRGLVERTPGYDLEPGGSSDEELDDDGEEADGDE